MKRRCDAMNSTVNSVHYVNVVQNEAILFVIVQQIYGKEMD